jgi:hypothetical protein
VRFIECDLFPHCPELPLNLPNRKKISDAKKNLGEHFGIVPIEAMFCGLPVVAVNDGGPTETVVDGSTGFLCKPEPESFAEVKNGDCFKVFFFLGGGGRAATPCASPPHGPPFSNDSFLVHHPVNRDDQHSLEHAIDFDFTVALQ